jgi:hypothetical protein
VMSRKGSWDSSKAFSKLTVTRLMTRSAGREWYMPLVGLMPEDSCFEAVQLNPRDPVATPIVARMDELFAVDAEARRKALSVAARHVRRQERAKPLLEEIRGNIEAAQSVALPASALSKACHYALTLWRKLTRFLEYPELELSNNLAENSMVPWL